MYNIIYNICYNNFMTKKKVIAYLHTHWDREWYREFEIFRIRLLRVFDNILDMLEQNKIPCFYFDGQVGALLDYLKIRPEKEELIRELIKDKKLFIGPAYCLIDEYLTDKQCFEKNLEIGLKISKEFGCKDFIGYLADTFGHSKHITEIFKSFGIDKSVVWRGCNDNIPANFKFNGINCVNLVRGYFMDIFAADLTIDEKTKFLKNNLDKISEKSSNILLMPIGADHLGISEDITHQIREVNARLEDYQIILGSPFDYFKEVENEFEKYEYNDELRDNSITFILQGCYSSRMDLKKLRAKASYMLDLANRTQKHFHLNYSNLIEYAYKLLIENMAHDGICGCSTDDVHFENKLKYKKIIQIAQTIIDEARFKTADTFLINLGDKPYSGIIEFESEIDLPFPILSTRKGFENEILQNTLKIPVTEDYKNIYTYLFEVNAIQPTEMREKILKNDTSDLEIGENYIKNSKIKLEIIDNKIKINDIDNFIEFVDYKDLGDSYNFAPDENDYGTCEKILSSSIEFKSDLRCILKINTENLEILVSLDKNTDILDFKTIYNNKKENHKVQAKINTLKPITETYSEDLNKILKRDFDPNYDIRKNLPKTKGIEAKTNTAPMQRYVNANGIGIVTKGLTEYEIFKNSISITLLRATGIISNPKNPARSTPAGPPLPTKDSQLLGENICEFSISFHNIKDYEKYIQHVYNYIF